VCDRDSASPTHSHSYCVKCKNQRKQRHLSLEPGLLYPKRNSHHASSYIKVLVRECDREVELINNLLDLQQLEAMSYSSELEIINL